MHQELGDITHKAFVSKMYQYNLNQVTPKDQTSGLQKNRRWKNKLKQHHQEAIKQIQKAGGFTRQLAQSHQQVNIMEREGSTGGREEKVGVVDKNKQKTSQPKALCILRQDSGFSNWL